MIIIITIFFFAWALPSFLVASPLAPSALSRSTFTQKKKRETVRSLRLSFLPATFYPASSLFRLLDQEDKVIEALLVVVATYLSADVIIL